jgi:hypothetical protein
MRLPQTFTEKWLFNAVRNIGRVYYFERHHVYVHHDIISLDDYSRNIATVTYNMAHNRCKIYYATINGYQRLSTAINGYQRLSTAVNGYQLLLTTI